MIDYRLFCTENSDWSEIDQVFSSDDEELYGYLEIGSDYKAQSVASNDALSDQPNKLVIQKTEL